MRIYNCNQMRRIENKANEGGMSYIQMMENAGKACAAKILKIIAKNKTEGNKKVCIICGNGKNGGDGFVIARYLDNKGVKAGVVLACGEPKAQEAAEMYSQVKDTVECVDISKSPDKAIKMIVESGYIVDCIFGIGFKGELGGDAAELVKDINKMKKCVISIDIPSGLEGDSGKCGDIHFHADYTLAVSCKKPVHILKPAADFCGKVSVVDIGFSQDCYDIEDGCEFMSADMSFVKQALPKRAADSNKGDFGRLLSICGSKNMQGAAVMCAQAAVRSGAGLVCCAFPEKAYPAIAPKLTEPIMLPLPDDSEGFLSIKAADKILENLEKSSAAVIGCGLGCTEDTQKLVFSVIEKANCPLVIDADGINALSKNINVLKTAAVPIILTPHPGEMARLTGLSISEIQSKRLSVAKAFAQMSGCIVVLKGCNTVISSPDGSCCVNPTGNAGMAKGGSGDVLAGIIASFCAQGMNCFDAAVCGAYIHGMCGDDLASAFSKTGITPTMMLEYLPSLFSKFEN